jgi:phosphoesterase RecJ-like protein
LINFALAIKGITFAIFIAEKDGITKLSLRSKGNIDVSDIAKKYFNGGGHRNASGGISKTTVNETVKLSEKIIYNLKK